MKSEESFSTLRHSDNFCFLPGSWAYDSLEIDLKHKDWGTERKVKEITMGADGEHTETVWVVDKGQIYVYDKIHQLLIFSYKFVFI